MKLTFLLLMLLPVLVWSQSIDSTWMTNTYLPQFYVDTGTYLPATVLIDTKLNKKNLSDFNGKILYIDVWATWCGNCLIKFPYQEQLLKRLKVVGLDSVIEFVNINIDDQKSQWKKALRRYHPIGRNLYCNDTSLLDKWNIRSLPAYILLDTSEKILGKDITEPDDALVDWLLYSASKGIHPVEALWRQYAQNKLMEQQHSSSAFTDEEYSRWFMSLLPAFLEYRKWQEQQRR